MMACLKCGAEIPDGATVCPACGSEATDPGARTVAIATDTPAEEPQAAEEQQTSEERDALLLKLKQSLAPDYDVERELGRGGMAVVYKAMEIDLHRSVALKVLPPGLGLGPAAVRFKREARMAAALDHPNIIPIYRVGLTAGTYYFAMKLVEGRALDAIIESQGALPLPVILAVLRASSSALAFAHERGIIHRDIKGANILVDRDGRVMVSDFGIARAAEEKTLTATGSVIGTPHFMSPEQCSGAKVGPQSDQYSLGILAFQMVTGSVPFDASSLMALLQHHYYTPVPDMRAVRSELPEALVRVVETALAKDPTQRYATTGDMVAALETIPFGDAERHEADELLRQLARGDPVPKVRTPSLPPLADVRARTVAASEATTISAEVGPIPRRRSRTGMVIAVVAVVAVAASAGYWFFGRQPAAEVAARPEAPAQAVPAPVQTAAAPLTRATADSTRNDTARTDTTPPAIVQPQRTARPPRRTRTEAQPAPAATVPAAAPAAQEKGMLRLRTIPPTAQIFVDGKPVGVGGLVDFEVAAGQRRLRIRAPGYVTLDTLVTVSAGATLRLGQVTLKSAEGGQ
jgi:serine/threonine-protein kinase